MTQTKRSILQALVELESAVQSMAAAHPKPDLRPLFARLDALAGQLPRGTDPDLLHYLRGKSYRKARLWLEGRDVEDARGAGHPSPR